MILSNFSYWHPYISSGGCTYRHGSICTGQFGQDDLNEFDAINRNNFLFYPQSGKLSAIKLYIQFEGFICQTVTP